MVIKIYQSISDIKIVNKKIVEYDFGYINARLAKLGDELNHLVMLCHQGLIETVDLSRFDKELESIKLNFKDVNLMEDKLLQKCSKCHFL